ncbi:MAG: VanZ family protein [Anaeroplasmataceae bacterium]|nr:VanZ family protein [Anaeroplasmataceae bacterium]
MKNKILRVVPIIIVLAWMGVIFYFSHQNGTSSSKMSNSITKWIVNTFVPNYSNLTRTEQSSILKNTSYVIRKLAHYTEYALLGLFLFVAVYAFTDNEKIIFSVVSILGILYAFSDELHQSFIGGRAPAIKDVLIDSIGLLTILVLIGIILNIKRIRRIRKKKVEV